MSQKRKSWRKRTGCLKPVARETVHFLGNKTSQPVDKGRKNCVDDTLLVAPLSLRLIAFFFCLLNHNGPYKGMEEVEGPWDMS